MTDLRAIPLHPYPLTDTQLDTLKQAKAELDLGYRIQPVRAVPGVPMPVLAFEEAPVFACRYALVKPGWRLQNVKEALYAVLERPEDPRLYDELDFLRTYLGDGVQEITDQMEPEVHGPVFR